MRFPRKRGSTSVIVRVFIPDNTSTTGAGLTGLTNASTNLAISYSRELQNGFTQITGANILDITTLGTWLDPTAGKIRFKAVDATNAPGLYELQFADGAAFGTGDVSQNVIINILELTTSVLKIGPNMVLIPLVPWDYQDGVRMGMTGLANAVPGATGGLAIVGSVMGKSPATLAPEDCSGNLPVDLSDVLMEITEGTGTLTATGAVQTVYEHVPSANVEIPDTVHIDLTNMAEGDTIILKLYRKVKSGGAYVLSDMKTFTGAQAVPGIKVQGEMTRYGWKVTLQQTAGVNRDYDWERISVT